MNVMHDIVLLYMYMYNVHALGLEPCQQFSNNNQWNALSIHHIGMVMYMYMYMYIPQVNLLS